MRVMRGGAVALLRPAALGRFALSTRASRAQDTLVAHPGIAKAVTYTKGGDEDAIHAVIMPEPGALYTPWHGMHGNAAGKTEDDTLIDWINEKLRNRELRSVNIVSSEDLLPTMLATESSSTQPPTGELT